MSLKLGSSINYEAKDLEASSYSLMKLVPLSGAQRADIGPNSGQDITFEVPVQAINWARSYFSADVAIGGLAEVFTHKHEGLIPFSSMSVYTRGGQYLLNLQERGTDYSRVIMSADSKLEELASGDIDGSLYRSKASAIVPSQTAADTSSPYWQQQYAATAGTVGQGFDGVRAYKVRFPLSQLKETILAVDKSILFREVLVVKLRLAPGRDIAWTSDTVDPTNFPVPIVSNVVYTNMALFVAQERNASVVEALNAQTESEAGFSLLIPYPSVFTNERAASTQQNVSLRLNKSHGSTLKAIKHCIFASGADNLRYDRENRAQQKVQSYYTNVNNNRLTEYNITCSANEDYAYHKRRLQGTPALDRAIYKLNWFHEDNFTDHQEKMSDMHTTDTNVLGGINLNEEVRWDIYATTPNTALRHFTIVHGQKMLNVNARGLVVA